MKNLSDLVTVYFASLNNTFHNIHKFEALQNLFLEDYIHFDKSYSQRLEEVSYMQYGAG